MEPVPMEQALTTQTPLMHQFWLIFSIGMAAAAMAFLMGRKVLDHSNKDPRKNAKDLANLLVDNAQDRRSDPRRKGNSVEVDLCDPRGRVDTFGGYVLDRSRGGVGLMVPFEVPVGTTLNVRPRVNHNPHSIPIEVRSCRPNQDGYLLGCQFVQTPPWNILMLFG